MIPPMILVGLVVGRWWVTPLAGVGWALLIMGDGVGFLWGAAVLGAVNYCVGVPVHKGLWWGMRKIRRAWRSRRAAPNSTSTGARAAR